MSKLPIPSRLPVRTPPRRTNIVRGLTHAEYAQLGAEIDCDATVDQLERFCAKFKGTTDPAMYALRTYAAFKCFAVRARLDGRIEDALRHEESCELTYEAEIKPENRW